jgi:hypothetical protein
MKLRFLSALAAMVSLPAMAQDIAMQPIPRRMRASCSMALPENMASSRRAKVISIGRMASASAAGVST